SGSQGPLLVHWTPGADYSLPAPAHFVDVESLKVIDLPPEEAKDLGSINGGQMYYRASADGRVFTAWGTNLAPAGITSLVFHDNRVSRYYEPHGSFHVVPSPDGSTLYTS